ncbi:MAG: T9SS type A sorting domain-containing protein [Ferruginibacter sp.]
MKQFCLLLFCISCSGVLQAQDPAYPDAPAAALNITAAEYFFDNDPGFGNGTSITISASTDIANAAVTVNTAGLSNGVHQLYLRTRNSNGSWSLTSVKNFTVDYDPAYTTAPPAAGNITAAEYFIDDDPGFGNGIAISITAAADISNINAVINTTGFSNGVHRVYLRTKNAAGKWSLTSMKDFIVDTDPTYPSAPAAMVDITAAEYFIDDDPGFGNATAIAMSASTDISNIAAQVNVSGLTTGVHRLYLRSRNSNGRWSLTNVTAFTVDQDYAYPDAPAAPGNISYAEYFFDDDPGFGNGTGIAITPGTDISNMTFSANTAGLADGAHTLYIRSKNNWSITNYISFIKGQVLPLRFLAVTAAASGNDVLVNWTTADEINTSHFIIEYSSNGTAFTGVGNVTAANTPGTHHYSFNHTDAPAGMLYYRIRQVDADGTFSYSNIVRVNIRPLQRIAVYPNPATNEIGLLQITAQDIRLAEIITADGKTVQQFSRPSASKWNIQQLPAALYRLRITRMNGETETLPFIKQ